MAPIVIPCMLWVLNGVFALKPNASLFGKVANGTCFILLTAELAGRAYLGV